MFFYLSKIFWVLLAPATVLLLVLVAGTALLYTRFKRAGRAVVLASVIGFFVFGVLPVGTIMLRVLEDRFPPPPDDMPDPAGIIVLGGGVNQLITRFRGPVELTNSGDRMTEGAMLARRFPEAKLVFTGGSAALLGSPYREAHAARQFFLGLGLPAERLLFEDNARNTFENAVFTRDLVNPKPGEKWLLVTSASHMPRAMAIFRKAGFEVTPYPVDYETIGVPGEFFVISTDPGSGLRRTDRALREYIGLFVYWWTGKTDELFPGPGQSK